MKLGQTKTQFLLLFIKLFVIISALKKKKKTYFSLNSLMICDMIFSTVKIIELEHTVN